VVESDVARKRRARRINRELAEIYPDAHTELDFTNPLELSVATILSAQCTTRSSTRSPEGLRRVPHGRGLRGRRSGRDGGADPAHRLLPNKTTSLIKLGQALVERFDGEVPPRMKDLVTLARLRPQDRERGARQRVRHPGITVDTHLWPTGATVGVDHQHRPGEGGG
jgi:endonuclease-3